MSKEDEPGEPYFKREWLIWDDLPPSSSPRRWQVLKRWHHWRTHRRWAKIVERFGDERFRSEGPLTLANIQKVKDMMDQQAEGEEER